MTVWISVNGFGRLVSAETASVSVFDHGITVGDGVFETLKIVDGEPFALSRHLQRLRQSAQILKLTVPDENDLREAVAAVLNAHGEHRSRGRLRITVTAGEGPLGSDRSSRLPTWIIATSALPTWPSSSSIVTIDGLRNPRSLIAGAKTTSYAENVVALELAHNQGASEAIVGTVDGLVCEGTGSNVFAVIDQQVCTPTLSTGCLDGITRQLVLQWSQAIERDFTMEQLRDAREVFITSSTRDVHPVTAIDGRILAVGPRTAMIAGEFAKRCTWDIDP